MEDPRKIAADLAASEAAHEAASREFRAAFAACAPPRSWSLEEIRAAWYQAQETGRAAFEPPREADDLANSWEHVRAALMGEEV